MDTPAQTALRFTEPRSRHRLVSSKELSFYLSVTGLRHLERQHFAPLETEYDEKLDFLYFSHPIVNLRIRKPFIR